MDIFSFPGLTGWPSLLLTIFALVIGGWYITKHAKSGAEAAVKAAQASAIDAMQAEINSLRSRIEDEKKENERMMKVLHKENTRLEHIIETMVSALKSQGIIITINGEIINISIEDPKKITTVRIQDIKDET